MRLAGDLPHLLTFPRGGNIDSPPRITLDSWRGADSLIERLDLLERLLEVFDQVVAPRRAPAFTTHLCRAAVALRAPRSLSPGQTRLSPHVPFIHLDGPQAHGHSLVIAAQNVRCIQAALRT